MSRSVKSAARVLRILDYFDEIQKESSVKDIATALSMPVSSTSLLLKQMYDAGYLDRGKNSRGYLPSVRVSTLGIWVDPVLSSGSSVIKLMQELGELTSELIILAIRRGDTVRYIHMVPSKSIVRVHLRVGTVLPLALSCVGRMFMAEMSDKSVKGVVFRHNQTVPAERQLQFSAVESQLKMIRQRGYARSPEAILKGVSGLAMSLPVSISKEPMVLAIGAISPVVEANYMDWVKLMVSGIARLPRAS